MISDLGPMKSTLVVGETADFVGEKMDLNPLRVKMSVLFLLFTCKVLIAISSF